MKRIAALTMLVLASVAAASQSRPIPAADTQLGMNAGADKGVTTAEAEMNALLSKLKGKAKGNLQAIAMLDKAQAAWVGYRDAQLKVMWPSPDQARYGGVFPCASQQSEQGSRTSGPLSCDQC